MIKLRGTNYVMFNRGLLDFLDPLEVMGYQGDLVCLDQLVQ